MLNLRADLHIHTIFSDGTATPEEVVARADLLGLTAFALTDHDTVSGIKRARAELARLQTPISLLTGSELTCYDSQGRELHILAYGFSEKDPKVVRFLTDFMQERQLRTEKMVGLLNEMGIDISMQEVDAFAKGGSMGRLHLAKALVKKGAASNVSDSFRRLIGNGAPAYVPKRMISPKEIVDEIHGWGGVAILAHPTCFADIEDIERFLEVGIDGFEAYHPTIDKKLRKILKKICKKYGMLVTGGSDTHGSALNRPNVGGVTVPYHFVEELLLRIGVS